MGFLWVAGPTFVNFLCTKRRIALFLMYTILLNKKKKIVVARLVGLG